MNRIPHDQVSRLIGHILQNAFSQEEEQKLKIKKTTDYINGHQRSCKACDGKGLVFAREKQAVNGRLYHTFVFKCFCLIGRGLRAQYPDENFPL